MLEKNFTKLISIAIFTLVLVLSPFFYNAKAQTEETQTTPTQDEQTEEATVSSEGEQKYVTRKEWKADESIRSDNLNSFGEPKRLVFVEINTKGEDQEVQEFVKELYYFFTFKMAFGDIPAHFMMDEKGVVYEARFNGMDSILAIDGYEKGDIVIYYLGDLKKATTEVQFEEGYKKLFEITGIDYAKTVFRNLDFKLDVENKESKITMIDVPNEELTNSFALVNENIGANFQKVNREYKIELGKINYEKSPTVGSELNIQVEVKNVGTNNIYFDGESELFVANNTDKFDSPSKLYSAKSWATKSRSSLMSEANSIVPKGKMAVLNFKASVPLMSGELSEKFILINKRGDKFEDASFDVALNLDLGKKKVVEVKDNEFGFLRVRKEARGAAEEVTRILPGERYEWIERTDTGYYKIKLTDGTTGYVVGTYVKVVQ